MGDVGYLFVLVQKDAAARRQYKTVESIYVRPLDGKNDAEEAAWHFCCSGMLESRAWPKRNRVHNMRRGDVMSEMYKHGIKARRKEVCDMMAGTVKPEWAPWVHELVYKHLDDAPIKTLLGWAEKPDDFHILALWA